MYSEFSNDSDGVSRPPVLILGGSGFIGSRLAAVLTDKGIPIRIGDQNPSALFPIAWQHCDVRDRNTLRCLCQGVGTIVNLAAEHRDDVRPDSLYYETNVKGASEVCASARDAGISKIVFTSSVAVYGFHSRPVDETGSLVPFNSYGRTKLEAEGIYSAWAEEDPSRTLVVIRPTVVFGEGNRGNVYNLMHQIATGKFMMVGSGANRKSMAYVENVADFLLHILSLGSGTHIFNYVDGPDLDMNTLVALINRSLNRRSDQHGRVPRTVAMAGGFLLDGIARITGRKFPVSAIRVRKFCESTQFLANRLNDTGFHPRYSLEEALARTVRTEFSAS